MESPNVGALRSRLVDLGLDDAGVDRLLQTFNVSAFAAFDPAAAGAARGEDRP
jgi:hypothetical protein